jgi:FlaA1/EpsC-like NDP-sugar epimerase
MFDKNPVRAFLAMILDAAWVTFALYLAYWLRFNLGVIPELEVNELTRALLIAIPVQVFSFWMFGVYRGIWRFASVSDLIRIARAVGLGTLVSFSLLFLIGRLENVPRSVFLLYPVLLFLGVAGSRVIFRWFREHRLKLSASGAQRALIIGAGGAGEMLVRDLIRNKQYLPVGFLDDDHAKHGRELHGVRILGSTSDLVHTIDQHAIDVVLLAIPSAGSSLTRMTVEGCRDSNVRCVTLPSLEELDDGRVDVSQLREIRIEDLLGREMIELDDAKIHAFLDGMRVLVTGAGGSIGTELCRQVSSYKIEQLIMVDHGEFNLYQIEHEMQGLQRECPVSAMLGDVRDESRMRWIFEAYQPDVVLHAAAYKHVPLVEDNPAEGLKTNVFGTKMVADLAVEYGVRKFLLVSTDKAVNPTNVMGASKRTAEIYCQTLSDQSATAFITTRFGNVLGSAGSVVPLFRKQIEAGGPITVTHPEITRFFMTIPEAVSLILQAAAMGAGGEIYVLDMGEPVKIVDLARQMIRLAGREPDIDISIEYIGLRPGEKLYEELFHGSENLMGTVHPKILLAEARKHDWDTLQRQLEELLVECGNRDIEPLKQRLHTVVPEYHEALSSMPDGDQAKGGNVNH